MTSRAERQTTGRVEEELRGIDALCDLWSRELWDWPVRGKNPIYRGMREREGAGALGGPPVASDSAMLLDRVLAEPGNARHYALVKVWYVESGPAYKKAEKLNTNKTDYYAMWRRTLEYLRGRMHGLGLNI